jgi:chaperone BCS1
MLYLPTGCWVWILSDRKEANYWQARTVLRIQTMRWNQKRVKNFLDSMMMSRSTEAREKITIYYNRDDRFYADSSLATGTVSGDSLPILPGTQVQDVVEDMRDFLASREFYESIPIPWRRCYMFKGIPGSGKTSLVRRIAVELGLDLCVIEGTKLKAKGFVSDLLRKVPSRSIVLLEDITELFGPVMKNDGLLKQTGDENQHQKRNPDQGNMADFSLSDLQNAIDGVGTKPGLIIIITTNFPEKIPKPLKRKGRVKYELEFTYITKDQAKRFFLLFFRTEEDLAEEFASLATLTVPEAKRDSEDGAEEDHQGPLVMSDLQEILVMNRRNPTAAVKELRQEMQRRGVTIEPWTPLE